MLKNMKIKTIGILSALALILLGIFIGYYIYISGTRSGIKATLIALIIIGLSNFKRLTMVSRKRWHSETATLYLSSVEMGFKLILGTAVVLLCVIVVPYLVFFISKTVIYCIENKYFNLELFLLFFVSIPCLIAYLFFRFKKRRRSK